MSKLSFTETLKSKKGTIKTKLDLFAFEQDGFHFIYAPALDLSGYGENEKDAQKSFSVVFKEYINYTLNKMTLESDLNKLGWKIVRKGKNISLKAPDIFSSINENKHLRDIWSKNDFRKYNKEVEIPVI